LARLQLPTVTLCAASSVNVQATADALHACSNQIDFAECLLFTDSHPPVPDPIRVIPIARLATSRAYSHFLLNDLVRHIRTAHCLIVQWDGFVLDPRQWDHAFLDFDYIGAPWPQFQDRFQVGNGGFSLRSRRLLEACSDSEFRPEHPEDVAICRTNRALLEKKHHIRFADLATARRFAFERTATAPTFGFHGAFNLIETIGPDRFWELYLTLDDPSTIFTDLVSILRRLGRGRDATRRRLHLLANFLWTKFSRAKTRGAR
jgi:hypothetical protein